MQIYRHSVCVYEKAVPHTWPKTAADWAMYKDTHGHTCWSAQIQYCIYLLLLYVQSNWHSTYISISNVPTTPALTLPSSCGPHNHWSMTWCMTSTMGLDMWGGAR
jgi:hypothetical protein